jgi:hypothetical protein
VKENAELSETCDPEEEGGHGEYTKSGGGSARAQDGKQRSSLEFAAVISGILASTLFGSFGWS